MRFLTLMLLCTPLWAQTPKADKPLGAKITEAAPPIANPGQEPKPTVVQGMPVVPPPKAGSVDEAVANALKQHPDVKLAEAKRAVADAEYEQTRLLVTQRITNAFAKLEQAKARLELAKDVHARMNEMKNTSTISELSKVQIELQTATADLAVAEADLQAAKGGNTKSTVTLTMNSVDLTLSAPPVTATSGNTLSPSNMNKWTTTYSGTVAATKADLAKSLPNLREVLEKKIVLNLAGDGFTVEGVVEALKAASGKKDLIVRIPAAEKLPMLKNYIGEQTLHSWLEMIMDDLAVHTSQPEEKVLESSNSGPKGVKSVTYLPRDPFQIYVRDYGLLITNRGAAPSDALTLADYVKLTRTDKTAKP